MHLYLLLLIWPNSTVWLVAWYSCHSMFTVISSCNILSDGHPQQTSDCEHSRRRTTSKENLFSVCSCWRLSAWRSTMQASVYATSTLVSSGTALSTSSGTSVDIEFSCAMRVCSTLLARNATPGQHKSLTVQLGYSFSIELKNNIKIRLHWL